MSPAACTWWAHPAPARPLHCGWRPRFGRNQYLKRWRATANGLEAIAQGHNDALLVLDELAQVSPHEAGEIAYMLANGSGKQRARRDGLARPASVWRVLFLSAGEVGLADHMAAVGKRAKAGQEVRLADVPVEGESGQGLFQELHGHPSGAALADALTEAVRAEHGTAAREYLRVLVENPHRELRQSIEAARAEFLECYLPMNADGQARRVCSRFALIAAAGELATELGLTGWEPGEATEGTAECFRAWIDRRGGAGCREDKEALERVRDFLQSHGDSRFEDQDQPERSDPKQSRLPPSDTPRPGIPDHTGTFRKNCQGLDHRAVARLLRDRGHYARKPPTNWSFGMPRWAGVLRH